VSSRLSFEKKVSDFATARSGRLYSGACCCCCCCLHWIGALGGAIVGGHLGWKKVQKHEPLPRKITRPVGIALTLTMIGLGLGVLAMIVLLSVNVRAMESPLLALALVPSLVLLPAFVFVPLAPLFTGSSLKRAYLRARATLPAHPSPPTEGVFRTSAAEPKPPTAPAPELAGILVLCGGCMGPLPDEVAVADCPTCGNAVTKPDVPVARRGVTLALATVGGAFGLASVATVAGYLFMYILFALK
jgi:hypothetical protein